jgi:DNA-binding response OmpR family regulator
VLPEATNIATVVVCEDDEATLELLCDHLAADRYEALPAPGAADALRLCHYKQPDLMVLDLVLPDAAGLDVLREVRAAGRGSEHDRVRGLREGADDYIVKPVHYPELAARIAAVLRRREGRREGPRRVGDLVVDPATRSVRVGGRSVELANKEFALLRALAADPTRVFTKEELLRDVWDFRSLGKTRTLDSHASRLRRKLDPQHGRFVVNCWGIGYRLVD